MPQPTTEQTFSRALQLHQAGRVAEAERIYRQVLAQQPNHVDALQNLGIIAQSVGRYDAAADLIRRAIALKPDYAQAYSNLGNVLNDAGQFDESIVACTRAIALKPDLAEAHNNLAIALTARGRFDQAIAAAGKAIALRPNVPEAHINLGIAHTAKGQNDQAIAAFRKAINLRPTYADAHINLGNVLREKGLLDEAVAAYRQAIALKPNSPEAYHNLGIALTDQGLLDEAIESHRCALKIKPNYIDAFSSLQMALLYRWGNGFELNSSESREFAALARPLQDKIANHPIDRSPDRCLRIGYISADFRRHPVGAFLLPLLQHRDRTKFEIYCYSNSRDVDDFTNRLKESSDFWRDIIDLSDDAAAALVRSDAIDILVDLSAHTRGNRLFVFARKPAPIQVTYLAYPGATGLDAIDYRLTDPHLDPPDQPSDRHAEKPFHLPHSYWCYVPLTDLPPPNPLPALSASFITFGSLNNFAKATPPVLQAWSEILSAVPDSHFAMHAITGSHRDRVRDFFADRGIRPDRIQFIDWLPLAQYWDQFAKIDIALDSFPYAGGTTTCNALWMGVPVVTLAGHTAIGRGGVSILSNIGLPELIAQSSAQYVEIAAALAGDLFKLSHLRSTIREKMKSSPLMDARQLADDLENAYRRMWQSWTSLATG